MSIIKVDYGELAGGGTLEKYELTANQQKNITIKNGVVTMYHNQGAYNLAVTAIIDNGNATVKTTSYATQTEKMTYDPTNNVLTVDTGYPVIVYASIIN